MRIRRQRILSTFLLYFIAGNTEKLSKMLKITEMHSDIMVDLEEEEATEAAWREELDLSVAKNGDSEKDDVVLVECEKDEGAACKMLYCHCEYLSTVYASYRVIPHKAICIVSSVMCRLFIIILHTIPVVVMDSCREVDEVKELLGIAKDYVLALRIELKRKEEDEACTNAQTRCKSP
ncbi:unnamed protein product [Sphagnum balticum]